MKTTAPFKNVSPYYADGWYFEYIGVDGDASLYGPYATKAKARKARRWVEENAA